MSKTLQQMIQDEAENIALRAEVIQSQEPREAYLTATLILGAAQRLEAWTKRVRDEHPTHEFTYACPACKASAAQAAADCMRRS